MWFFQHPTHSSSPVKHLQHHFLILCRSPNSMYGIPLLDSSLKEGVPLVDSVTLYLLDCEGRVTIGDSSPSCCVPSYSVEATRTLLFSLGSIVAMLCSPQVLPDEIQRVINCSACLIYKAPKSAHITPLLFFISPLVCRSAAEFNL